MTDYMPGYGVVMTYGLTLSPAKPLSGSLQNDIQPLARSIAVALSASQDYDADQRSRG
jgi:hypothetical protein